MFFLAQDENSTVDCAILMDPIADWTKLGRWNSLNLLVTIACQSVLDMLCIFSLEHTLDVKGERAKSARRVVNIQNPDSNRIYFYNGTP